MYFIEKKSFGGFLAKFGVFLPIGDQQYLQDRIILL